MKNYFLLTVLTFVNARLSCGAQVAQPPVSMPTPQPDQLIAPRNPVGPVIVAQAPMQSQSVQTQSNAVTQAPMQLQPVQNQFNAAAQAPMQSQPVQTQSNTALPTFNIALHSLDPSVFNTNNMIGLFKYIELRVFQDVGTRERINNWLKNHRQEILNILNNSAPKQKNTLKARPQIATSTPHAAPQTPNTIPSPAAPNNMPTPQ